MKTRALLLAFGIGLLPAGLSACGVKSDLERPHADIMGTPTSVIVNPRKDPSRPPRILGQPGGEIPPYPTGP